MFEDTPRKTRLHRPDGGFSLLEILIAVTILVLMGGVVAVNLFPNIFKAQRDRAQVDVDVIKEAIGTWRLGHNGKLPDAGEFPQCLTEKGEDGREPYLDSDKLVEGRLLDPWGHEYVYTKHSSSSFEVISYGADGAPGGEGDNADISSKRNKDN